MNPAHVFLISLAGLAIFWLGVYCGNDASDNGDLGKYAFILGILITLGGGTALVASLCLLVAQAL